MRFVNGNNVRRVQDFNGYYALSRVLLTAVLISVLLIEIKFFDVWYTWLISIAVLFWRGIALENVAIIMQEKF